MNDTFITAKDSWGKKVKIKGYAFHDCHSDRWQKWIIKINVMSWYNFPSKTFKICKTWNKDLHFSILHPFAFFFFFFRKLKVSLQKAISKHYFDLQFKITLLRKKNYKLSIWVDECVCYLWTALQLYLFLTISIFNTKFFKTGC